MGTGRLDHPLITDLEERSNVSSPTERMVAGKLARKTWALPGNDMTPEEVEAKSDRPSHCPISAGRCDVRAVTDRRWSRPSVRPCQTALGGRFIA